MNETKISRRKLKRFLSFFKRYKPAENGRPHEAAVFESRLGDIEKGITQILAKQTQEYSKLLSMDKQLSTDFASTRTELSNIENELKQIEKKYGELRNVPPLQLNRIKRGISRIKRIIQEAKTD